MLSVWWNSRGLIHFEVLHSRPIVTSDVYVQQLELLDQALKNQGVNASTVRYLQDYARSHTAKKTQEKLEELNWECLPQPPYSPDLAPSDYRLFRSMQHFLTDKHLKDHDEVRIWVSQYFDSQLQDFFSKGIRDLKEKWRKTIANNGEYLLDYSAFFSFCGDRFVFH